MWFRSKDGGADWPRGGGVKERGGEEGDRIRDGQLQTLRHLTLFSSWETGTQRKRVKNERHFTKM